MRTRTLYLALAAALSTASVATAQGDMTVHRMGFNPGNNAAGFNSYGVNSGIAAYSVASQSCNIGNVNLVWTSGNGQTHPVISQNVYRLKGRRFEQLGQSWLKHGFCALCESGCGPGVGGGCASVLRVGCADTYSSGLNDGQGGGPKFTVDPVSGDHLHPDPTPTGNNTIRGRLQVAVADVDPTLNAGATYFVEGMYVHYEDHQNGFARNNATWRKIQFANNAQFTMQSGSTVNHSTETIVEAWKAEDANVDWLDVENTNEGGAGIHGYYQVATRVWDNGDGTWEYHYLVNNQNSTQGAYEFSIPKGSGGLALTDVWFNDVDYHSGEPQDGTDWTMSQNASDITWTCPQTYAQNPDANAINWCTAYSFGFTANSGPVGGTGTLEMFEPGVGGTLAFPLTGPGDGGSGFTTPYCFGDGTGNLCGCFNFGNPGEGCSHSGGSFGAVLASSGNPSAGTDTLVLEATGGPSNVPGLFFSGNTQPGGGLGAPFGDGLLCAGGSIVRLEVAFTGGGGNANSTIGISAKDGSNAGDTRYYQYWFRDVGGPCGNDFNTSGGLAVTWGN